DVPDECVVHHHGEVARHLQLVATPDTDAVDPSDRRLADLAQSVVHVLEGAEPLPVLARIAEVAVSPLAEIGPYAERPPGPSDDDHEDLVVPRGILRGPRDLAQRPEVER